MCLSLKCCCRGNLDLGETARQQRQWSRCERAMESPGCPSSFPACCSQGESGSLKCFHLCPNGSLLVFSLAFHEVSVYPKKELPFFILFTAGLCSFTAMLALLTHQFPELMGVFAKAVSVSREGALGSGQLDTEKQGKGRGRRCCAEVFGSLESHVVSILIRAVSGCGVQVVSACLI